ncbi:MAG: ABC transporter substrate-binding protein [Desulfobacterales bacterium]|nr:ABC transporter substrate-binding protein [Desulfobacterales bacterium]MBF0395599.1 ABC transporter substrate-binding protein [Desulfobacterales bacterium]
MYFYRKLIFVFIIIYALITSTCNAGSDKEKYGTSPKTNSGKLWNIGYLEGGTYPNYPIVLKAIVNALSDLGWIEEPLEFPNFKNMDDTSELWRWLSKNAKSKYINFLENAYWSSNWDDKLRKTNQETVLTRLKNKKDINLIIAMGTWAGQDLANDKNSTPTVVCSASDPLRAKIIKSLSDSGYDFLHAQIDPSIHQRQIRLFHDIVGFKRLGISYQDTPSGRSYAALEEVEKVAKERGFEIVTCFSAGDVPDINQSYSSLIKCHEELAPKIDAMYLTTNNGLDLKNLPRLMKSLNKYKIPTFSQNGSEEVKHGVLFSISQAGFKYVGRFHAEVIAKILNGAKPRDIGMIFEDPSKIAINLGEAQIIGYDPPVDILGAADEIFQEIMTAQGAFTP